MLQWSGCDESFEFPDSRANEVERGVGTVECLKRKIHLNKK